MTQIGKYVFMTQKELIVLLSECWNNGCEIGFTSFDLCGYHKNRQDFIQKVMQMDKEEILKKLRAA